MRRLYLCLMMVCVALMCPTMLSAQTPKGADIEFESKVIDLGTLSQSSGRHSVTVEYTNTGDVPLVVTEVRTSCSCTTIRYERKKVMPGDKGTITLTLDSAKAPQGSFYRVVQVFSTAKSGTQHLTLKAEIK